MAIIMSTINVHVYTEIQDNFLVASIENWFDDIEVIFQDDNASCHIGKVIKSFLQERLIKSNKQQTIQIKIQL